MSTLELKELSHPSGEVIKIASGKTLDLKSQGTTTLPTGSVLQVVQATSEVGIITTTTNTWIDTDATATITPTSASSKILIMQSTGGMVAAANISFGFQLLRGSTPISTRIRHGYAGTTAWHPLPFAMEYLDSPNTTSAITYKFQVRLSGTGQIRFNPNTGNANIDSGTVILMEIQG